MNATNTMTEAQDLDAMMHLLSEAAQLEAAPFDINDVSSSLPKKRIKKATPYKQFEGVFDCIKPADQANAITAATFTSTEQQNIIANARKYLIDHVGAKALKAFELPSHPTKKNIHVCGLSGGKDSSALAIVLITLFPHIDFYFIFTDTGAESKDVYANIYLLQKLFGLKIIRLSHPLGLIEYIKQNGGFLPSQKNRFCTPEFKVKIIDQFFKDNFDYNTHKVFTHVGFTYGEDRIGMISDEEEIESSFPLIKLKISVTEVFGILERTIGISEVYRSKSRSGCYMCFYQRRSEKTMMLFARPDEFQSAKSLEKLTTDDMSRYSLLNQPELRHALYSDDAISLNGRQDYFIPSSVDVRTEFKGHSLRPKTLQLKDKLTHNKHEQQLSIFDVMDNFEDDQQQGYIYVAVGMWISSTGRDYFGDMGYSGLYRTEYATFSKSLTGLKKSLHFWCEHKLNVAPLYGQTVAQMRKELKVALYQISVPKAILEVLKEPNKDSFTWAAPEAYQQIETLTRLTHSVLTYEGLQQFWDQQNYQRFDSTNMDELWLNNHFAHATKQQLNTKKKIYETLNSTISWSGIFPIPSQIEMDKMTMAAIREKQDLEFKMAGAEACAICSV